MKNKKLISYISHIIESQDFSIPIKVNLIGGVMEIFSATSLEPQAQEKKPQENKTEKKQKIVSTARYWKYKTEQDPNSKPKGEKIRMSIKRGVSKKRICAYFNLTEYQYRAHKAVCARMERKTVKK
jgi:hypothetical protein|tara:strand:- start:522 stop:899 length:378 start_codon:yes stop_codon:yes gene_type:complete